MAFLRPWISHSHSRYSILEMRPQSLYSNSSTSCRESPAGKSRSTRCPSHLPTSTGRVRTLLKLEPCWDTIPPLTFVTVSPGLPNGSSRRPGKGFGVSLSVVVPAFNERENIPDLYTGIVDAL